MPWGQTQAENDLAASLEQRIEDAVGDLVALGRVEAEIKGADIDPMDRDTLLGRCEQYRIDDARANQEDDS